MKKIVAVIILICLAVAATGCIGFPGNFESSPATQRTVYTESPDWGGLATQKSQSIEYAAPVPALSTDQSEAGPAVDVETKIIKTSYISLEVMDVVASVDSLKALATGKGGYISSSNLQKGSTGRLTATVIMRIPQAQFESVLENVKASGTVKSVSTRGEDVTEQYVDLEAQKTSYQNQLAQYNEIMKRAVNVEDVIKIQEQIDRVRTELDRLEGRLRYLNSRIDLSTITVNLEEPEPVGGETGHSFITAINEGIAGFFGMIDVIIILFITFLPLIIIGGAGYWIYHWRKGKKKTEAVTPSESADKK
ncbi:MAG: hypothetical protein A4E35_00065 [Methanoregula sp. PtaU1.Bin051]|nr:MAG: hypothetical protein A4E35_00065 [Methanoregula sp. PtaU1.Bin051]